MAEYYINITVIKLIATIIKQKIENLSSLAIFKNKITKYKAFLAIKSKLSSILVYKCTPGLTSDCYQTYIYYRFLRQC